MVVKSAREGRCERARATLQSVDPCRPCSTSRPWMRASTIRSASAARHGAGRGLCGHRVAAGRDWLYGVLAFVVGRRSGEIGLRIAIGAQPRDVMRLVVGQGMRLLAFGLALGLGVALVSGRVVATQLFGISSMDPATFIVVAAALALVALVACLAPAARAARVDPIDALRSE
jgi:hypothetical protein